MSTATIVPHIWLDANDRAWLDDTNVKVIEVVLDHLAYGWSAEEIHTQHRHLTLSQTYAALAYYYDNQEEFDRQIEQSRLEALKQESQSGDSPLRRRLRALGKL